MDIVAMMCKDKGIIPKEDYSNIENLALIDGKIKAALFQSNGLRNRLFHRYNQTDDHLTVQGIDALLPELLSFAEMVQLWIREQL